MESEAFISGITAGLAGFGTDALSAVFTAALGLAIPCVIGWFGYRFLTRKASQAFKKGSL